MGNLFSFKSLGIIGLGKVGKELVKLSSSFGVKIYVHDKNSEKINNKLILPSQNFLKNKNLSKVLFAQKKATENIFDKKKFLIGVLKLKKEMKRH